MQRLVFQPRQQFGRLHVIKILGVNKHGKTIWQCQCDCGTLIVVAGSDLRNGHTTSCGCAQKDAASKAQLIHGESRIHSRSDEYAAWVLMKQRCYDPSIRGYESHGGRGITVCDKWLNSFKNFLADMGRKPAKGRGWSLDRINNDGNYEPTNCRWATPHQQASNRRKPRWHKRPVDAL